MVVIFSFHSIYVSGLSGDCESSESCVRFCCDFELLEENSCGTLTVSEFRDYLNVSFVNVEVLFGKPCDKMQVIDDAEWKFEVNDTR